MTTSSRVPTVRRVVSPVVALGTVACLLCSAAPALATVGWSVRSIADPTHFYPGDEGECILPEPKKCDRYQVVVLNTGDSKSVGTVTLRDKLPTGLTTFGNSFFPGLRVGSEEGGWSCQGEPNKFKLAEVVCTATGIPPGSYAPALQIPVTAPAATSGSLKNEVTVEGGGAPTAKASEETTISSVPPSFGVTDFSMEPVNADGTQTKTAAGRPGALVTDIEFPTIFTPTTTGASVKPVTVVEQIKDVVVELPLGLVGDPQALPRCAQYNEGNEVEPVLGTEEFEKTCTNQKTEVGAVMFDDVGAIQHTGNGIVSPVYNIASESGFPAEFGFSFQEQGVNMYASVVRNNSGYRVRVAAPGITTTVGLAHISLAFFGDANQRDKAVSKTAFLTNPSYCSVAGPLEAKVEANSWEHPEHWVSAMTVVYPQVENCDLLQFGPLLEMAPSPAGIEEGTSQADEPSAYSVDLKVPQKEAFETTATPELRKATVTLPQGVSVSPSAAEGLAGCAATGPHGIDISNDEGRHPDQAGEGEEIGPDGLSHLVAGHCPDGSKLGTVEVITPLLSAPLKGHVFLAQPECGGTGQPECTDAYAEAKGGESKEGKLYGLYIEAQGAGVVVKLAGSVSANPSTGQLTATFDENPQFPFSELKLHFHGGPRAPIANPQSCGSFATTSTLTSWAEQEAPRTSPSFGIDWDGHGGACPGTLPFAPGFRSGTTNPAAGAFSPFVLSFSRNGREQDLSGLTVTLPQGLLGKIAGVPLCGEEQANAGTCGPESQLGSASVLTGPGTHPLSVTGGRVYLTTGYKGQPFGLSIVVPAVAGPFNLGNVVVRASIHIDQNTSQVTVTSDPLPQSRDGVPFRLRTVITEITRPGFTFNPTNCSQQQIAGTITGSHGATANVASPFAVTGCAGLPFKPSFTASTAGKTSKANGASLVVNVVQKPGEANIHKVALTLPLILPARLTTLQKACTEAQFNTNPAGCPEASFIGMATANTPVLPVPLTGPAILVSHGGAAFPDVEFILQGDGVQIVLDGKTDIKKEITYSRFETVPDAPISSFVTTLPQGPHSALAANGNLCATTKTVTVRKRVIVRGHGHTKHVTKKVKKTITTPLQMPTTITGQNGAQIVQSTKIAVTGCPKVAVKKKAKAHGKKARNRR